MCIHIHAYTHVCACMCKPEVDIVSLPLAHSTLFHSLRISHIHTMHFDHIPAIIQLFTDPLPLLNVMSFCLLACLLVLNY